MDYDRTATKTKGKKNGNFLNPGKTEKQRKIDCFNQRKLIPSNNPPP